MLVGAGNRGTIYAKFALQHPELYRIVGVVEPDRERRECAGRLLSLEASALYASLDELLRRPKIADAVFNCTMDKIHEQTSIPLLQKGYHMLLEKPIAPTWKETEHILETAQSCGRIVTVCHVLRYAPFYQAIKERIIRGELGRIINIQMAEQVSYYHESVSYVRGKYADPEICGSGMLLSKCVHDLDLMAWLMSDTKPKTVFSRGSVFSFRPEYAPEGAEKRCLPLCPHQNDCPYSAKLLYTEYPQRWVNRVYDDSSVSRSEPAELLQLLASSENPYGKCVYYSNIKIVDHQSVLVEFEDGAIGTFSMNGGAAQSGRTVHIVGTRGEIEGTFEEQRLSLRRIAPSMPGGRAETVIDVSAQQKGNAHGGGDERVLLDFYALMNHEKASVSCTSLRESVTGHRIVYAAEQSRTSGTEVEI